MPADRHDGALLGGPPHAWLAAQKEKRPPERSRLASQADGPRQPRPWGVAPGWVDDRKGVRLCCLTQGRNRYRLPGWRNRYRVPPYAGYAGYARQLAGTCLLSPPVRTYAQVIAAPAAPGAVGRNSRETLI